MSALSESGTADPLLLEPTIGSAGADDSFLSAHSNLSDSSAGSQLTFVEKTLPDSTPSPGAQSFASYERARLLKQQEEDEQLCNRLIEVLDKHLALGQKVLADLKKLTA